MARSVRGIGGGSLAPYALGAATTWNVSNVGGAPELLAGRFGIDLAGVGLLTSAVFLAHLLTQIPGGRLVDRYGPRTIGMACLVLTGSGSALLLLAPDVGWALVLRFVVGMGSGVGFVAGASYVRQLGGTSVAQGVYGGFSVGGGGVAIAVVAGASQYLGWRAVFISSVFVALVAMAILARSPAPQQARRSAADSKLLPLLKTPLIWRLAICQAATFGLSIVASTWLVVFLIDREGVSRGTAGLIAGLVLAGGIVGRPWGGMAAQRRPDRGTLIVVLSMIGAGVSMLMLALVPGVPAAVIFAAVFGFSVGVPFGPIFHAVTHGYSATPGLAVAVMNVPAMLLIMAGSPLLGAALQWSRPGLAFVLVGGLVLVATPAARWGASVPPRATPA